MAIKSFKMSWCWKVEMVTDLSFKLAAYILNVISTRRLTSVTGQLLTTKNELVLKIMW